MSELIDVARDWVEKRNGAYLAKEDVIVYYASLTGRKSDFKWITLSLTQVVRIIRATLLSPANSGQLNTEHVIAACQELDRVFEFGMKSRHKLNPEIFNYLSEADMDMGDSIVSMLAEELYQRNYSGLLVLQVLGIIKNIAKNLDYNISDKEWRELIHKHFPTYGYELRTDQFRPQVDGKKQAAIMQPGTKPSEIYKFNSEDFRSLTIRIRSILS